MPTYEYTCAACKHEFERFESITAPPNKTCPKCNKKKAVRRISGGGGFLFKGSGFYITDYKKSGQPKTESKPAASSEGKPAESKSESKPAESKSEGKPAESKSENKSSESKSESKPAEGKSGKSNKVA